jgi:hypothetical protein
MKVRLDGPGTTDGSGRFVCGGSVLLRGEKLVKVCMARIVPNYSAFRKRNRFKDASSCFAGRALSGELCDKVSAL